MWLAALSFIKSKVFSQTGAVLLPLLGLIAVFLIWNSDLILTELGYETRSNLKAQVVQLQHKVDQLETANASLSKELLDTITLITTTEQTVDTYYQSKETTQDKVKDFISKRNELIGSQPTCECVQETLIETETNVQDTIVRVFSVNPQVSKANITVIHDAYSTFFAEVQ